MHCPIEQNLGRPMLRASDVKHDAETQARMIEVYWHRRGFPQVKCEVIDMIPPSSDKRRRSLYGIRSNLVNGVPQ